MGAEFDRGRDVDVDVNVDVDVDVDVLVVYSFDRRSGRSCLHSLHNVLIIYV